MMKRRLSIVFGTMSMAAAVAVLVTYSYAQTQAGSLKVQANVKSDEGADRTFVDKDGDGTCDLVATCHPGEGPCNGEPGCRTCVACPTDVRVRAGCAHCYEDLLERAEQLKLSEAQITSLKHLAQDSAWKWIDMDADFRKAQHELTEILDKKAVDLTEVVQQIERAAKEWGDLRYACVRNMIEVKEVLTPEQWSLWRKETGNMTLFALGTGAGPARSMGCQAMQRHVRRPDMCWGSGTRHRDCGLAWLTHTGNHRSGPPSPVRLHGTGAHL